MSRTPQTPFVLEKCSTNHPCFSFTAKERERERNREILLFIYFPEYLLTIHRSPPVCEIVLLNKLPIVSIRCNKAKYHHCALWRPWGKVLCIDEASGHGHTAMATVWPFRFHHSSATFVRKKSNPFHDRKSFNLCPSVTIGFSRETRASNRGLDFESFFHRSFPWCWSVGGMGKREAGKRRLFVQQNIAIKIV